MCGRLADPVKDTDADTLYVAQEKVTNSSYGNIDPAPPLGPQDSGIKYGGRRCAAMIFTFSYFAAWAALSRQVRSTRVDLLAKVGDRHAAVQRHTAQIRGVYRAAATPDFPGRHQAPSEPK